MFRILCIFAIWIGWSSYHPTRGKSVAPSIISMTDVIKRTDIMRKKMALKELLSLAKEKHGDKFDYSLINDNNYIDTKHLVFIKCCKHNYVFSTRLGDHIRGNGGCPICKSENISKKKKGVIKEKKGKVFGVGINDSTLVVGSNNVAYRRWVAMLHRCYGNFSKKHPTYSACSVCEEWLVFSNFEKWFEENYKDGYELDKDLLSGKDNKIYSPETCCFLPQRINKLILTNKGRRSNIIGSSKKGDKWESFLSALDEDGKKKRIHLGYFNSPQEAFAEYKLAKESYVKEVAQEYYDNNEITEKVYNALMNYKVEITD